jgi:hypothetical protein
MNSLLQMMGLGMPQTGNTGPLSALFQPQSFGPYQPLRPVINRPQEPAAMPTPPMQPPAPMAPQAPRPNPGWFNAGDSMRNFTPGIGANDPMGIKRMTEGMDPRGQLSLPMR